MQSSETGGMGPSRDVPTVVSVNVGLPRVVEWRGRQVSSAIWKEPIEGPIVLEGINFAGDDQADRRVHGGIDKAVYAYSVEDYEWWATTTGPLRPGTFGENLTTRGVDLGTAHIGDRWRVGSAILQVSQPRQPCFKIGIAMGDDSFPGAFAAAGRPGTYLRIITAGSLQAGDLIVVDPAALPAVRVDSLVDDEIDEAVLRQVVDDPRVPEGWRRLAARALAR